MNRFRFFLMGFCFVTAALFAENHSLAAFDHDCSGADCPICILIQTAENFLRHLKNALFQPAFQAGILLITVIVSKRVFFSFIPQSPVWLKVKMNR